MQKKITHEKNFQPKISTPSDLQFNNSVLKTYFRGKLIEEWPFHFGFVMPNTTNTWENLIEADTANIMPASMLRFKKICFVAIKKKISGNIVIETIFYNETSIVSKSKVRFFYV